MPAMWRCCRCGRCCSRESSAVRSAAAPPFRGCDPYEHSCGDERANNVRVSGKYDFRCGAAKFQVGRLPAQQIAVASTAAVWAAIVDGHFCCGQCDRLASVNYSGYYRHDHLHKHRAQHSLCITHWRESSRVRRLRVKSSNERTNERRASRRNVRLSPTNVSQNQNTHAHTHKR